jgi:CubicO group peptidase (beta-lactamase class C family)
MMYPVLDSAQLNWVKVSSGIPMAVFVVLMRIKIRKNFLKIEQRILIPFKKKLSIIRVISYGKINTLLAIFHFSCKKLTLKNTYYVPDQPSEYISRGLVHGYIFLPEYNRYVPLKTDVTYFSLSPTGAAGAIISTPQDIEKWIQAVYNSTDLLPSQQRQELESFISEKTGRPIVTPIMGYGLGIQGYYNSSTSEVVLLYLGETLGYRSIYTYYPKENVVISALVNSAVNDNNNHISELVNRAFEIVNDNLLL